MQTCIKDIIFLHMPPTTTTKSKMIISINIIAYINTAYKSPNILPWPGMISNILLLVSPHGVRTKIEKVQSCNLVWLQLLNISIYILFLIAYKFLNADILSWVLDIQLTFSLSFTPQLAIFHVFHIDRK